MWRTVTVCMNESDLQCQRIDLQITVYCVLGIIHELKTVRLRTVSEPAHSYATQQGDDLDRQRSDSLRSHDSSTVHDFTHTHTHTHLHPSVTVEFVGVFWIDSSEQHSVTSSHADVRLLGIPIVKTWRTGTRHRDLQLQNQLMSLLLKLASDFHYITCIRFHFPV